MFANTHPLGFLAAAKAQEAEHVIGQTERLVIDLGPSQADLKPAEEALHAAKALYSAAQYAQAVVQAKRAAALANHLNERFNAYLAAWKSLQACREELQAIGFPTAALETALGLADTEVAREVEEDGTVVPNYLGATAMLERAMEEARTLVARAREASREIFLATLATEALSDSPSTQVPSWLAIRLERRVEQATCELALGNVAEARRIASEARARADDALAGAARSWELLDLSAAILDGLGAGGRIADALAGEIESARDALDRGFLDRTTALVLARRLSEEVAAFARHYPPSRRALERAMQVYSRLQGEGYSSYEVDTALSAAQLALEAGDWAGARDQVGRASQAFVRFRNQQDALNRSLMEIEERVTLLKDFRLPLLPDVRAIVGRAKEEVRSCRLSGAKEDLLFANALMMQATRTGS